MQSCSVILPVSNRTPLTPHWLQRVVDGVPADVELIVVESDAAPRTSGLLEAHRHRIRRIATPAGSTTPAARNAGAAAASHRYLLFLDLTTVTRPGWLEALIGCAERNAGCGVIGGLLLDGRDVVVHAGVAIGQDRTPRPLYRGFPADHAAVRRSRPMQAVSGGYVLVDRDAFERADGFDPTYTQAGYDEDLCFRLAALGYRAFYCHDSVSNQLDGANSLLAASDRALLRARWAHRLQPDDLDYYMRDGLLRIDYDQPGPLRLQISPLLATADSGLTAVEAGRLLADRARHTHALWMENQALAGRVRELEANAASAAVEPEPATDGDLVPPESMVLSVGGEFQRYGEEYFGYFREIGGLTPTERVLDIGCGVGRMAVTLAPFLEGGSYEGFDIRSDVIEWCQQHITPRYPHARFSYVDIANGYYNSGSTHAASAFEFPYPPASFDFVVLVSVFTHMLPSELQHYTAQIASVLKPGGRCFCTYFLLNDESLGLTRAGLSGLFRFDHQLDGYRAIYPTIPESAVAYDEAWIRDVYRRNGLRIVEPIRFGHWCGRLEGLSLQDIVLAVKDAETP